MKRVALLAASALGLMFGATALHASADSSCEVSWRLDGGDVGCGDAAMLSPGNDTRVNLLFLLRDRDRMNYADLTRPELDWDTRSYGTVFFDWSLLNGAAFGPAADRDQSDFAGSRCVSLSGGSTAFQAALAANRSVPAAERALLASARVRVEATCKGEADPAFSWPQVGSAAGKEFLTYLQAADGFYAENWEAARAGFAALARARDPWVAEAALYMQGRVELNAAQATAFSDWGNFQSDAVNRADLNRSAAAFRTYLDRYAKGRYAASARGLVRRTLWLGGDLTGLGGAYDQVLAQTAAKSPASARLVEEIDQKLLIAKGAGEAVKAPMLLATIDLMRMRESQWDNSPRLTAAELEAQAPVFAADPDLYGFLQASQAFHVGGNPARVLQLIADDARKPAYTPLGFSRQMLRGMALSATKDRNAAGFWRELLGGANQPYQRDLAELGLALELERNGKLNTVFAPGSLVEASILREILLQRSAGAELLRGQAQAAGRPQHERDVALFTLLYKQLSRGRYADFARDVALVRRGANTTGGLWNLQQQDDVPVGLFNAGRWSDGYSCPAIDRTAASLARNPADVKARLCLGDFWRLNGFDDFAQLDVRPKADELGGVANAFGGARIERGTFYQAIIADRAAAPDDRAYALYRAVYCYAPSGGNSCGGEAVPVAQRKAWHDQLKRDYPASVWARKLRYFW